MRHFGKRGSGDAEFNHPVAVATARVDALEVCVAVADMNNHRVQLLDAHGAHVRSFGTRGAGDGQLFQPWSVAFLVTDTSAHVLVADRGARFDHRGVWFADAGRVQQFCARTGAYLRTIALPPKVVPRSVTVAANGEVLVLDAGTDKVVRLHVCT